MPLEIATMHDLAQLKMIILSEIKALIPVMQASEEKMLKSADVCKMLRISTGTLQNLRNNKTIVAAKIGGTWYYRREDILRMLTGKK